MDLDITEHGRYTRTAPVAIWHKPVVMRLFWPGFPVMTHSRFSESGIGAPDDEVADVPAAERGAP